MPTKNQLGYADNVFAKMGATAAHDILGTLGGQSLADLHARKQDYVQHVIHSGETPALALGTTGHVGRCVISESEIVCEYLDATSACTHHAPLVPRDPVMASRVRMSMKAFNAVPPAIIALLKNQDPARDADKAAVLDAKLVAFTASLEQPAGGEGGRFCHGTTCTLADVHSGPFLFRFDAVLRHYRRYHVVHRHPRLGQILAAMEAMPEWSTALCSGASEPVTAEKLVLFYKQYAHNSQWDTSADGRRILAGRGASQEEEGRLAAPKRKAGALS